MKIKTITALESVQSCTAGATLTFPIKLEFPYKEVKKLLGQWLLDTQAETLYMITEYAGGTKQMSLGIRPRNGVKKAMVQKDKVYVIIKPAEV